MLRDVSIDTSQPAEHAFIDGTASRRTFLKASGVTAAAALLGSLAWPHPDTAHGQATQRPISDFLNAQGSTTVFVSPEGDNLAWSTPISQTPITMALVDYSGVWAKWLLTKGISLGTTTRGTVSERPLPNGKAEVTVVLHTTRALTWVVRGPDLPSLNTPKSLPRLFGYTAEEVWLNPTKPRGLAESHLQITFINTAPGAPLPDLVGINLGTFDFFNIKVVLFDANATGPLRLAAGLGPDDTPGRCLIAQTGLVAPALRNAFRGALGDTFPREIVDLRRQ